MDSITASGVIPGYMIGMGGDTYQGKASCDDTIIE